MFSRAAYDAGFGSGTEEINHGYHEYKIPKSSTVLFLLAAVDNRRRAPAGKRNMGRVFASGSAVWCGSCPLELVVESRALKLLEAIIMPSLLIYLLHFMTFLGLAGRNGIVRRNSRR